jgi:hypothetical protein
MFLLRVLCRTRARALPWKDLPLKLRTKYPGLTDILKMVAMKCKHIFTAGSLVFMERLQLDFFVTM